MERKPVEDDQPVEGMAPLEMMKVIHRLRAEKMELDLKNKSPRQSQVTLEIARKAYQDLWESSPAGSVVINRAG